MSSDLDLDYRPHSYWSPAGPLSAIVQNIKGQNRRQMARDLIAGGMDQQLGEIEADLLDDTLTPEQASVDTRIQPPVDTRKLATTAGELRSSRRDAPPG
jgi:hypothetical protein